MIEGHEGMFAGLALSSFYNQGEQHLVMNGLITEAAPEQTDELIVHRHTLAIQACAGRCQKLSTYCAFQGTARSAASMSPTWPGFPSARGVTFKYITANCCALQFL
jgi:hypothetical protein